VRLLLSCENFDGFGGTETYALTVAQQLERLGHEAWIYTPNAGAAAGFARRQGVRIVGMAELPSDCDAVFAQDAATCFELARRYGGAPRVFVAHSRDHALQGVPQLRDICDAVVVLNDRVGAWVQAQAAHPPLTRLRQPVDTWRFAAPRVRRSRPRHVLVTSNYVSGARADLLERACTACGLDLHWIGTTSRPTDRPEVALANADIVIGLGRSVIEGMAAGCAAYVYGIFGGDGWVTAESYRTFEADGFAGLSSGELIDVSRLAADLRGWDPGMGETNRDLAASHHAARVHVIELVALAEALQREPRLESDPATTPSVVDELARLVRLEWQMYGRAVAAAREAEEMRGERERYRVEAERATERIEELERVAREAQARLAALVATRRYRLGGRVAAPLDWARSHRRSG
jgi:hypothetical protein